MKQLPKVGDRIVVHTMLGYVAKVESLEWNPREVDWMIHLDWGKYGKSRVFARDQDKVWYCYTDKN